MPKEVKIAGFPPFAGVTHIRQLALTYAPQCRGAMCRFFCKRFGKQFCPDPTLKDSRGELCSSFEVRESKPERLASLLEDYASAL